MPIGLIAGNGTFPLLVLRAARQVGHDVVVVAIEGECAPELEALAAELGQTSFSWVQLGQLGTAIKALKAGGASQAVMAGQVKHVKLFGGVFPDMTLLVGADAPESQEHRRPDRGRGRCAAGSRHHADEFHRAAA